MIRIIKHFIIGFILTFAFLSIHTAHAVDKPNFVVIVVDDAGYGDFSSFGGTYKTPSIDSLATNGIKFTNFYAESVCTPSRAALITGRYPDSFGLNSALGVDSPQGLPNNVLTLPGALKNLGYQTALVGKWHLGHNPGQQPLDHGFDFFYGMLHGESRSYDKHLDKNNNVDWYRNRTKIVVTEYSTTAITRESVNFIDRNSNKPFYLQVAYQAPHVPFQLPGDPINSSKPAVYGQMLRYVDQGVGNILQKLKAEGIANKTYVLFYSDNGGYAGHNGILRGVKDGVYEGGIRVPFILHYPSMNNSVSAIPKIVQDIFPTFLKLAGGNTSPALVGENLFTNDYNRYMFWYNSHGKYAVRKGNWKLVVTPTGNALYNLNTDVKETTNVAGANPAITNDLQNALRNWKTSVGKH